VGQDGPIIPIVAGRILAGLIPNSSLVTIDDGHLFLRSRIDDIVPVIRDFLSANGTVAFAC
jgi:pimeloyl-ACP methyl ester carboxylesterase